MNQRRSATWPWVVLGLGGVAFFLLAGLVMIGMVAGESGTARVGLIQFYGPIADVSGGGLLSSTRGAQDFIAEVEKATEDTSIKAVVLRINSPGGSAAASQEMYQAVLRLRAKKPVVCSMGDVAASGGYYIAAGCNKIYANPSTITGSIGVITQLMNFQELFKKIGLSEATIKSGKFKDAGNPARPLTAEERQLFQSMLMSIYYQFVDDVTSGRKEATKGKLTRARVLQLADGRVYTGVQAKANGLVDETGGLHDAIAAAGKLGGISGKPKVYKYGAGGGLSGLLGASAEQAAMEGVSKAGAAAGNAFAAELTERLKTEASQPARPQLR